MLNKKLIAHNFSASAKNYDQEADIQKQAASQLIQYLGPFIKADLKILDLGSGSSFIAKNLCQNYVDFNLQICEIDLAEKMLQQWESRPHNVQALHGDFENFDFGEKKFDIIISSFSLQWLENYSDFFAKIKKTLSLNGIFIFCLPIHNSLSELEQASLESGCNFNFLPLPQIDFLKNSLLENNFKINFLEIKTITEPFTTAVSALKKIKKLGAHYSYFSKKFISKKNLADFNKFYLKYFVKNAKNPAISWNIAYIIAL